MSGEEECELYPPNRFPIYSCLFHLLFFFGFELGLFVVGFLVFSFIIISSSFSIV